MGASYCKRNRSYAIVQYDKDDHQHIDDQSMSDINWWTPLTTQTHERNDYATSAVHVAPLSKLTGQAIKVLIFGYVRKCSSTDNIDDGIIQFITAYSFMIEMFNKTCKGINIQIHGSLNKFCTLHDSQDTADSIHESAFGTIQGRFGKHHWKFKVIQYGGNQIGHQWMGYRSAKFMIGIINTRHCDSVRNGYLTENAGFRATGCISLAFDITDGRVSWNTMESNKSSMWQPLTEGIQGTHSKPYGRKVKIQKGLVIDMYLDLNKRTLSFSTNIDHQFIDHGIAFENIDGRNWNMGITIPARGTAVKIVTYDCFLIH